MMHSTDAKRKAPGSSAMTPPRAPARPGASSLTGSTSSASVQQRLADAILPTDVSDESELPSLPKECLSSFSLEATDESSDRRHRRPLRHVDEHGRESFYALRPMTYSVGLILLVELLERFSFYGIYYTLTLYLTGAYSIVQQQGDDDAGAGDVWDPGFTSVEAASLVSVSTAVAYTTPFLGAMLADAVLGDYYAILFGSVFCYLPGISLICLTTVPHLWGAVEFHTRWLVLGLTVLWPLGTGMIKSVVNVFGARQHHPILQSSLVERYYISFYVAINTGALAGITAIPIVAQRSVTVAYLVPIGALTLGILAFAWGTPRYVISRPPPRRSFAVASNTKPTSDASLVTIFRISLLIVPFAIAYSQMPTTFILQGTVMAKAGWNTVNAATMNSVDAASVLVFGHVIGHGLYPALSKRGCRIPTSHKFAIGSGLAALAVLWAMLVESWIREAYYARGGRPVSVLWQAPSYVLIGAGEIFAISTAYEAAFSASPPSSKALASAVNIFCIGGLPNVLCLVLYRLCRPWFVSRRSGAANLSRLADYASARVSHYFAVLLAILLAGVAINLHPRVRAFVESVEEKAADMARTPVVRKSPGRYGSDEESPLLGALRRQDPRFGQHPVLNRMGSMRAGPALAGAAGAAGTGGARRSAPRSSKPRGVKYKYIPRLYGGRNTRSGVLHPDSSPLSTATPPRQLLVGREGRPIRAQDLMPASRLQPPPSDESPRRFAHHESA